MVAVNKGNNGPLVPALPEAYVPDGRPRPATIQIDARKPDGSPLEEAEPISVSRVLRLSLSVHVCSLSHFGFGFDLPVVHPTWQRLRLRCISSLLLSSRHPISLYRCESELFTKADLSSIDFRK